MVEPIPVGYHNITPYMIVRNAAAAIDFYKKAFNAVELMRFPGPGGKIMHAEVKIGDSPVMLADEMPEEGHVGPQTLGGVGVSMMLYVEDVDTRFAQAIAAGADYLVVGRPIVRSDDPAAAALQIIADIQHLPIDKF